MLRYPIGNGQPPSMRFVAMRDDGGVSDGPLLVRYDTTYPAIDKEGILASRRNGELVLLDDQSVKQVIDSREKKP